MKQLNQIIAIVTHLKDKADVITKHGIKEALEGIILDAREANVHFNNYNQFLSDYFYELPDEKRDMFIESLKKNNMTAEAIALLEEYNNLDPWKGVEHLKDLEKAQTGNCTPL